MPEKEDKNWFGCPVCGAEVPAKALACPECGSDDETGWSAEAEYDDLDLPMPDEPEADLRTNKAWWKWLTIFAAVLILIWIMLR